jgi:CubicO group peptidase (beta-lactamase class C family)
MKIQNRAGGFVLWAGMGLVGIAIAIVLFLVFNKAKPESAPPPPADYYPTNGWHTSTPEEQGIDSGKLAEGLLEMRQLRIHSLLLVRNGRVFLDAYFYPYDGGSVHDMASVGKSITTTLVGIAIDQGKLKLDDPMLSFFPEITITRPDARIEKITVRDLAMMANGLESTGLEQDEATLAAMEASDDWLKNAVDRRMASKPGTKFVYDSPGMHILSGILQKTTGMTELKYARQNLFGPLGIKDVIWPADPQGYTHGFGNIALHPRDAAKIGYLWLNQGVWEGRQIVSKQWVQEASRTQIKTDMGDNYSYGWWVTEEDGAVSSIFAQGRGGQYVQLIPALNIIIVITASEINIDQVEPRLTASVLDLENPTPPNPAGAAKLADALKTIQQPPPAQPVPALPEMAAAVSGKTYRFEPNAANIKTFRLDFDDSAEAGIEMAFDDTQETYSGLLGLDGVFRMTPGENGLPTGIRGQWTDAVTFTMDVDTIANRESFTYVLRFKGDTVSMEILERAHDSGITVTGTAAP